MVAIVAGGINKSTGKWKRFAAGDRFVDTTDLNINVDEFDTIVDASGDGDYTTIQAAIDAGGINIYVKNGTYTISSSIVIDNTDAVKKIVGQSRDGVILNRTANVILFDIQGALVTSAGTVGVTRDSLSVTGSGTSFVTAGVVAGDYLQPYSGGDIRALKIASVGSNVALTLAAGWRYAGNNAGSSTYQIQRPVFNLEIMNMSIIGAATQTVTFFKGYRCYGLKIHDTYLQNADNHALTDFEFCTDTHFYSNKTANTGNNDDVTVYAAFCGGVFFNKNWIWGRTSASFDGATQFYVTSSTHVQVEENRGAYWYGYINGCGTIRLTHNQSDYGLLAVENNFGGEKSIISDNILNRGNISVTGQSNEGVIINSNYLYDPTTIGIHCNSVSCQVSDNHVFYGDSTGIQVGSSNGSFPCIITDNYCYFNTLAGIYIASGANGNIVKNNKSYSNATYGIQIAGGSNNVITNNELHGNTTAAILDSGTTTQKYLNRYTNSDVVYGMADYGVQGVIAINPVTGIDAKVVATHNLFTVPTSRVFHVTMVIIRCTAATAITVAPTVGIGVAAGEDDIIPSQLLTGLDTAGKKSLIVAEGISVVATAGQTIKLGIDTGATGTSMTIETILCGVLI